MFDTPSSVASEMERRSTFFQETGGECRARAQESWALEAAMLGFAVAAGIGAGIWLGSLWLGAAAGMAVFSGVGGAHTFLARRFGWRKFSFYRVLSVVWDFVCGIDFIICLLRIVFV
ncbi:MAG: hypothetical protein ACM3O6_04980 [Acidobacteriota bacterium]